VNPKWSSRGAIEVDVFAASRADFETLVAAVEPLGTIEFTRDLQEWRKPTGKAEGLAEAVRLFNEERFWEAHEVLEQFWRVARDEEKRLLQGLILVCAAFVHLQKDEQRVAAGLAKRSIPLLAWREPMYHGVRLQELRDSLAAMVEKGALAFLEI